MYSYSVSVDMASRIPKKHLKVGDRKTVLSVFKYFQASFPEGNVLFWLKKPVKLLWQVNNQFTSFGKEE